MTIYIRYMIYIYIRIYPTDIPYQLRIYVWSMYIPIYVLHNPIYMYICIYVYMYICIYVYTVYMYIGRGIYV